MSGATRHIEWTGTGFDSAWIEYSSDGNGWQRVNDVPVKAGDPGWQRFPWLVPQDSSAACLVRIYQDSSRQVFSSEPFTIVALRILSPVPGETWELATTRRIRWESGYYSDVVVECSRDDGRTWEMIGNEAIRSSDPRWTDLAWVVDGAPSENCRIRLHEYMEPSYFYVSGRFSITGAGGR